MKHLFLFIAFFPLCLFAQQDSITTERFNFELLGDDFKEYIEREDGWRIVVTNLKYREYPPDSSYYCIRKIFHDNGILKENGKVISPTLKIGTWKYYDEQGYLQKTVDEDARFGKVKTEDIQRFALSMKDITEDHPLYNYIMKDADRGFREIVAGTTVRYDTTYNLWKLHVFTKNGRITYTIHGDTGDIVLKQVEHTSYTGRTIGYDSVSYAYSYDISVPLTSDEAKNIYERQPELPWGLGE